MRRCEQVSVLMVIRLSDSGCKRNVNFLSIGKAEDAWCRTLDSYH